MVKVNFKKQINFMAQSKYAFIISLICIALSILGIYYKGLEKGIDFIGGVLVEINQTKKLIWLKCVIK